MSHYSADLCVLLVHDAYGELSSRIFEGLLRHGRATVPAIQHLTRLSLRQIKYGLSVLVQQHLVFWSQGWEDDQAIFEADLSTAYNLTRTGKYIKITESRAGEYAGRLMSHLLLLGHVSVGELTKIIFASHTKEINGEITAKSASAGGALPTEGHNDSETNGDSSITREKIDATLRELLQHGLIVPAHEQILQSDADNRMEANRIFAKLRDSKVKSEKAKDEIQAAQVKKKLHEWNFGTRKERSQMKALRLVQKRPLEDQEDPPARKRQRVDLMWKHAVHSAEEGSTQLVVNDVLNDELVVRVNHHKFMVMMRNDHFVHLAEKAIGTVTSQVFQTALRKFESSILACKEDSDDGEEDDDEEVLSKSSTISTYELAALLHDDPKYADALGKADPKLNDDASFHPKNRRRKTNGYHEKGTANGKINPGDDGSDSDDSESDVNSVFNNASEDDIDEDFYDLDDDHTPHHLVIRQHLLLLSEHPDHFLIHIHATSTEPEQWAVDFHSLRRTAILKVIFQTIETRLGTISTRLARICQQYGRVDEKSLQDKSLLAQKDMRAYLLDMQKRSLLELQEVPRDNSRLASRTIFLYYMDEGKTAAKIRDECYKTMARCIQRLEFEREKVAGVLEKAERSDVKGREEQLLGAKEKEALGRWKAQEEMIWGEIGRVDDMVAVLRDF